MALAVTVRGTNMRDFCTDRDRSLMLEVLGTMHLDCGDVISA